MSAEISFIDGKAEAAFALRPAWWDGEAVSRSCLTVIGCNAATSCPTFIDMHVSLLKYPTALGGLGNR